MVVSYLSAYRPRYHPGHSARRRHLDTQPRIEPGSQGANVHSRSKLLSHRLRQHKAKIGDPFRVSTFCYLTRRTLDLINLQEQRSVFFVLARRGLDDESRRVDLRAFRHAFQLEFQDSRGALNKL